MALKNPRKLFLNVPVKDLKRSIDFFTALGFEFEQKFTDETATCMLIGEDAYAMLLTEPKFKSFTAKPVGDPAKVTAAMFAVTANSRAQVDELVNKALEIGGSPAAPPEDHGFMYERSFYDPDGHHWSFFWMDPSALK